MADDNDDAETPIEAANAAKAKGNENSARNKRLITGAAIGIGSAALVAALLYAKRGRRNDKA